MQEVRDLSLLQIKIFSLKYKQKKWTRNKDQHIREEDTGQYETKEKATTNPSQV